MLKVVNALFACALFVGAAHSGERPLLRSQVITLSEIVTIGDFYSNAGAVASVPLFRSPDMGTSGNVPAALVAQRARDGGLAVAGTDGLRTVVVHRGATKFNRLQLESLVRQELSLRNAGLDTGALEIKLQQAPETVIADPRIEDPIRIDRIDWSRNNGFFTLYATVAVEVGTEPLIITGTAIEMIEVLALSQPLSRGDIVQENDLTTIRLPRSTVIAGAVHDSTGIVGKAARTNLRPNQPLARKNFERPVLITRGDNITVRYEIGNMKLTTRAKAMTEGAMGDVIDVMNLQSRRIVPAVVLSRGEVRVQSASPIVASLNSGAN